MLHHKKIKQTNKKDKWQLTLDFISEDHREWEGRGQPVQRGSCSSALASCCHEGYFTSHARFSRKVRNLNFCVKYPDSEMLAAKSNAFKNTFGSNKIRYWPYSASRCQFVTPVFDFNIGRKKSWFEATSDFCSFKNPKSRKYEGTHLHTSNEKMRIYREKNTNWHFSKVP